MAKMSVLDMVQDILSDMDSDNVNSITDTIESMQVAQIVKSVYFELMARKNWPHLKRLFSLTPIGDDNTQPVGLQERPTHMKVPEELKEMLSLRYDVKLDSNDGPKYRSIEWLDPDKFLEMTNQRKTSEDRFIEVVDPSEVHLVIQNNKAPS